MCNFFFKILYWKYKIFLKILNIIYYIFVCVVYDVKIEEFFGVFDFEMVFVYILGVESLLYGLDCVVFVYCVNYISYVYKIRG